MSTRCVEDSDLVERARRGSTEAFGELVERHRTAVYRTALAALGSVDEAEEVVQDACVAAFRSVARFRGDASFKTWLLSITWRLALNRRRSLVRRLRHFVGLDTERWARLGSPGTSVENALVDGERFAHVVRLIDTLPKKLRDARLLSATGESYREIGRMLGIPEGTLKWRVWEARRVLKRKLARTEIRE